MTSMAASEKWASINGDDVLEGIKISGFDSALLMSLMDYKIISRRATSMIKECNSISRSGDQLPEHITR